MLDIFIILGIVLGLFFLILGKQWMHEWPFYISAAIFLIVGSGLLLTGWETFNVGNEYIISEINTGTGACIDTVDGICDRIQTPVKLFPATLEDNPILFLLGNVFIAFGLVFIFMGLDEVAHNNAAKKSNK